MEYPTESFGNSCEEDRRKELHETWLANLKFQPLWKIRNYFGEKIGLYFAWLGKHYLEINHRILKIFYHACNLEQFRGLYTVTVGIFNPWGLFEKRLIQN